MNVRPSRWLAGGTFLLLVPVAVWIAYLGRDAGLYPSWAIPPVFALVFAAGLAVVFLLLPVARRFDP